MTEHDPAVVAAVSARATARHAHHEAGLDCSGMSGGWQLADVFFWNRQQSSQGYSADTPGEHCASKQPMQTKSCSSRSRCRGPRRWGPVRTKRFDLGGRPGVCLGRQRRGRHRQVQQPRCRTGWCCRSARFQPGRACLGTGVGRRVGTAVARRLQDHSHDWFEAKRSLMRKC